MVIYIFLLSDSALLCQDWHDTTQAKWQNGQKSPFEFGYVNKFVQIKKQELPQNIQEQSDSIEIIAIEKAPIQR